MVSESIFDASIPAWVIASVPVPPMSQLLTVILNDFADGPLRKNPSNPLATWRLSNTRLESLRPGRVVSTMTTSLAVPSDILSPRRIAFFSVIFLQPLVNSTAGAKNPEVSTLIVRLRVSELLFDPLSVRDVPPLMRNPYGAAGVGVNDTTAEIPEAG